MSDAQPLLQDSGSQFGVRIGERFYDATHPPHGDWRDQYTEVVPLVDAEALARAVSASFPHGQRVGRGLLLGDALAEYLAKHPWSDL